MRRNALLALAVAALLVTAGCTGLSTDDTTDAEELQENAVEEMADAETYRMEMRMNISASGQTIQLTQHAVFDHEAEQARVNASMMGQETTTYIDGDTAYVNAGGFWQTQDLSESEPWNQSSGLRQQQNVLESGNVTVTGSETIDVRRTDGSPSTSETQSVSEDGVETTELTVEADTEELQSVVAQQNGEFGGTFEDATYRMYVANDTHRLRQVEMDLTMSVGEQSAEANATITFSEYGEPVDISIPEEATEQSEQSARPIAA